MSYVENIKLTDIKENGLYKTTNKNRRKQIYSLTDSLVEAIELTKKLRGNSNSEYLIITKRNTKYTTDGFQSIWQRYMRKLSTYNKETDSIILQNRFRFHNIRHKAATDAEKLNGREYARQLLGHSSQEITKRYIDGYTLVKPLG